MKKQVQGLQTYSTGIFAMVLFCATLITLLWFTFVTQVTQSNQLRHAISTTAFTLLGEVGVCVPFSSRFSTKLDTLHSNDKQKDRTGCA